MKALIVYFLKIKMKGLEFMNEIGIYLSFDRKMIFVSESYRVQDFFDEFLEYEVRYEFLEYEVRYVFNVTVMCFLDLNKTFKENHIAHCDMLIYGR